MNALGSRIAALSDEQRELLARLLADAEGVAGCVTPRTPRSLIVPATSAQRRTSIAERGHPGSAFSNTRLALRLHGPLDASALVRGVARIVRRHEALRVTFRDAGGELLQAIEEKPRFALATVDLRGRAPGEREEAASAAQREEAEGRFDMSRGPLLRIRLLRLADDEHLFLLTVHHAVIDGWSCANFMRELTTFYAAERDRVPSPLPLPRLQLPDYAVWQHAWLRSWQRFEQSQYWRRQLAGAPHFLELPPRLAAPERAGFIRGYILFRLESASAERVRAIARHEAATVFMTLLAAYAAVLARWSKQFEVVVGAPIAGRKQAELEDAIGLFTNVIALRIAVRRDESLRSLIRRVARTAEEGYAHQDLPIEELLRELRPPEGQGRAPLFQAMFAVHNYPVDSDGLADLEETDVRDEPSRLLEFYSPTPTRVDVCLGIADRASQFSGCLEFNRVVIRPQAAARLVREFDGLLAWGVEHPDLPLGEAPEPE